MGNVLSCRFLSDCGDRGGDGENQVMDLPDLCWKDSVKILGPDGIYLLLIVSLPDVWMTRKISLNYGFYYVTLPQ